MDCIMDRTILGTGGVSCVACWLHSSALYLGLLGICCLVVLVQLALDTKLKHTATSLRGSNMSVNACLTGWEWLSAREFVLLSHGIWQGAFPG
ncbi:hypothetical protein CONLIGDRAFT_457933 [Coniochaeta ligniaria NRRL 30616]|uniref:Uncharacterized protein n=1 Tax=Coniochaeta ligniaria NRRL 30616 TaxID=1408157 RepID=A0A1J7IKI9_9PEZI|nr:hypothetical protein CONLIGDRAFT_457933 [Coniochaeta ligniaria NRRL 30616]